MNDQNESQVTQETEVQQPLSSKPTLTPMFSPIEAPAPKKHSGLGIASFVLALVSLIAFIGLTIGVIIIITNSVDIQAIVDSGKPGATTMTDEELTDQLGPLMGFIVIYPLILIVVILGLILGIVGLARKGSKKVFAILGTVLNGLALLAVFILFMIGVAIA